LTTHKQQKKHSLLQSFMIFVREDWGEKHGGIIMNSIKQKIEDVINYPDLVKGLHRNDVEEILIHSQQFFAKERTLVELTGDVVFVGDIHGDFRTTKSIVENFIDADHLVFLGDYVDRGPESIETMTYLLILKCRYPEKVILLRGNHEGDIGYEFKDDVSKRYGSPSIFPKYYAVFCSMPLMVITKNIFASHAGILKGADRAWLRDIEKNDENVTFHLIWDDPDVSPGHPGDTFTETDLIQFLEAIKTKVFIRGHNPDILGYSIYGDTCLTIFSSDRYKDYGNGGILIARTDGDVSKATDIPLWDFSTGKWITYKVKKKG
jgi:hypothetical protein